MLVTLIAAACAGLSSCNDEPGQPAFASAPVVTGNLADQPADHVMVVINMDSADSQEVGAYYRKKRNIPVQNVALVNCPATDNITTADYRRLIEAPVKAAIAKAKARIDYIVLTRGIPIRLDNDGGYSLDAFLVAMNMHIDVLTGLDDEHIRKMVSPYFEKDEPFNSAKFNMYLVTRLDGYTVDDALHLVDSSLSARRTDGLFFEDEAANRKSGGYKEMEDLMDQAEAGLRAKKLRILVDHTDKFVCPPEPVIGYCSWGSNDGAFNRDTYKQIKFLPGAVAETFVSTSARTLHNPDAPGQSLIGDLIHSGVTGVKGYVSEPYTFALAQPNILFDRYTKGYNLAESFYMASLVLKWKDLVVGDPLCAPYAK